MITPSCCKCTTSASGPVQNRAVPQHEVRLLGGCGRDLLTLSLYAECRTMPNGSGISSCCRGVAALCANIGLTPFGIVRPLTAPLRVGEQHNSQLTDLDVRF